MGLTATPPGDLGEREAALYRRLFGGHADFEIVTPAVVKDGHLAPYAGAGAPRPPDARRGGLDRAPAGAVRRAPAGPHGPGVRHRRRSGPGSRRASSAASRPTGRRWAGRRSSATTRTSRAPPSAACGAWASRPRPARTCARSTAGRSRRADWIALLDGYVRDVLDPSPEEVDAIAREQVRRALPAIGYVLTRRGIRAATSVVDRVLGVSAAKAEAAVRILARRGGGPRRRGCGRSCCATSRPRAATPGRPTDGRAGPRRRQRRGGPARAPRGPGDRAPRPRPRERAERGLLARDGRWTWSRSRATTPSSPPLFEGYDPLAGAARRPAPAGTTSCASPRRTPGWTSRRWVPLVTAFFEAGGSRCLVGTRAMLGEGWNSRRANVLVDLGAATTSVSVQQVRGRTLRLDPDDPAKVADNWDVVCVAEGHVRGDADYAPLRPQAPPLLRARGDGRDRVRRLARRPVALAVRAAAGDVVRGARGRDARAAGPARRHEGRVAGRASRTGTCPSRRSGSASAGRPGCRVGGSCAPSRRRRVAAPRRDRGRRRRGRDGRRDRRGRRLGAPLVGLAAAGVVGGGAAVAALRAVRGRLDRLAPRDTLEDMGRALADAMAATGLVAPGLGAAAVRVAAPARRLLPLLPRRRDDGGGRAASPRRSRSWSRRSGTRAGSSRAASRRRRPGSRRRSGVVASRDVLARGRGAPEVWHAVPAALARRGRTASRRSRRPGHAGSARAPGRSPHATPGRRPCSPCGPATIRSASRPSSGRSGPRPAPRPDGAAPPVGGPGYPFWSSGLTSVANRVIDSSS